MLVRGHCGTLSKRRDFWFSVGAVVFVVQHFSVPVRFASDASSIWTENRLNARSSESLPIGNLRKVYIQIFGGVRSGTKASLAIESVSGTTLRAGSTSNMPEVSKAEVKLTRFLETRGVKVSNDPPPKTP
jgi:hypothetical protein